MRSILAVAAVVVAPFLLQRSSRAGGSDLDGQPAPEIRLTDGLNGASASTTLASLRGKVVLLKFWLTKCPICRGTLPAFQALSDRYGRSGATCLGVVIDTAEGVSPYLRQAGWTFPVGCDPQGSNASLYGVSHYPGDYVIGIDGVVRASNGFPRDVIEEELRKYRLAELGSVPDALAAVRDLVEGNDYGAALRKGEALAKAEGASAEVKTAVARLAAIARQRQDNRFLRVDALARDGGGRPAALAEAQRILEDFKGTSLETRALERVNALSAPR